jgi:hypothetical protein
VCWGDEVDSLTRKGKVKRKERLVDTKRATEGGRSDKVQLREREGSACSRGLRKRGIWGGDFEERVVNALLYSHYVRPSTLTPFCAPPALLPPFPEPSQAKGRPPKAPSSKEATTARIALRLAPSGLGGVQKVLVVATKSQERIEVCGRSTTFPSPSRSPFAPRYDTRSSRQDLYADEDGD